MLGRKCWNCIFFERLQKLFVPSHRCHPLPLPFTNLVKFFLQRNKSLLVLVSCCSNWSSWTSTWSKSTVKTLVQRPLTALLLFRLLSTMEDNLKSLKIENKNIVFKLRIPIYLYPWPAVDFKESKCLWRIIFKYGEFWSV